MVAVGDHCEPQSNALSPHLILNLLDDGHNGGLHLRQFSTHGPCGVYAEADIHKSKGWKGEVITRTSLEDGGLSGLDGAIDATSADDCTAGCGG